jgi:hypothetical protein
VVQGERLQPSGAVDAGHLGVQPHDEVVGPLQLLHQVGRHASGEGAAAVQQGDLLCVAGKVDGGLPGGVGAADHENSLASHGPRLGHGGAVEDPRPQQRLQARDRQPPVADSGGDDDGPADRLAAVGQSEDAVGVAGPQAGRGLGVDKLGAEDHRLLGGPRSQLGAADASREAEVVADQGGGAGLAADRLALQQQRA